MLVDAVLSPPSGSGDGGGVPTCFPSDSGFDPGSCPKAHMADPAQFGLVRGAKSLGQQR